MNKSLFALLCLFIISCVDDDDSLDCGVADPTQELTWLSAEIANREQNLNESTKYCFISQANLNGQPVFIYEDCNPAINKVLPVFDCEGELLGSIGSEIPQNSLTDSRIIWRPDDFACILEN